MPKVLLVEDDDYFAQPCRSAFEDAGFEVLHMKDASAGLVAFEEGPDGFALVVIDMAMPAGPRFSQLEARSGFHAGLALSRAILRLKHDAHLIGLTNLPDSQIVKWFKERRIPLLLKHNTAPRQLLDHMPQLERRSPRKCFIVHGHDTSAIDDLKQFIAANLIGYSPAVLSESRSGGLTSASISLKMPC